MSTHIDPSKARLWLDGDAFRAPVGTALPTDIMAADLTGWDAFGGIKAGFTITTEREREALDVWNNESGSPYRYKDQPPQPTIAMRPVDNSKATALTLLNGGTITEVMQSDGTTPAGYYEWNEGTDREFALILRVVDGDQKKAYLIERGELANIPTETLNAEDLEGWDMEVSPLSPASGNPSIRKFTTYNPLATA